MNLLEGGKGGEGKRVGRGRWGERVGRGRGERGRVGVGEGSGGGGEGEMTAIGPTYSNRYVQ